MRAVLLLVAVLCTTACDKPAATVRVHPANSPPATLSDWAVVLADGRYLELNDGVVPYDLNTPLFSDYALKLRTVWLPDGTSANYDDSRELDFPVGTIISKTFHYEKAEGFDEGTFKVVKIDREARLDNIGRLDLDRHVLIETRLLIRYEDGWRALPYVWNENQDDAILEIAGDIKPIELVSGAANDSIVYVVPDANQCANCHTPDHSSKELRPLGPKAWQLNRQFEYGDHSANQLDHWERVGILNGLPDARPRGARWSIPGGATLEERSKAYLDANCAHCHNASGAADTSALHLNIDAPVDAYYGVCKSPVAVGRGSGDRPYDIYPGRPEESIMVYRMQHSDPAIAMPELGRGVVHAEGVALISEWISQMDGGC